MHVREIPQNRSDARRTPPGGNSPAGYRVAVAVAAVVAVAALAWGVTSTLGLVDRIHGYPQVTAGSERSVEIGEPGERVLYYEGPEADRLLTSPPALDGLQLEVTDPAGAPVSVEPYETNLRYRLFDRAGEAVASFPAHTPGTYEVALADDAPAGTVIGIGEGVPATALLQIVSAAILVTLGTAAAGAAAAAARRRASAQRAAIAGTRPL